MRVKARTSRWISSSLICARKATFSRARSVSREGPLLEDPASFIPTLGAVLVLSTPCSGPLFSVITIVSSGVKLESLGRGAAFAFAFDVDERLVSAGGSGVGVVRLGLGIGGPGKGVDFTDSADPETRPFRFTRKATATRRRAAPAMPPPIAPVGALW